MTSSPNRSRTKDLCESEKCSDLVYITTRNYPEQTSQCYFLHMLSIDRFQVSTLLRSMGSDRSSAAQILFRPRKKTLT